MYLLFSRFNMLAKTRQTWKLDGMNTLEYETVSREYLPLYTNITVDIGTEEGLHASAAPPVKPAASESDVRLKSSANHKERHWGQFTMCFLSHQCGVLTVDPVSRACIRCGFTCLSRLKTVDLNSTSLWLSRSTLIHIISMSYSSMDGVGLWIYIFTALSPLVKPWDALEFQFWLLFFCRWTLH